MKVVFKEPFKKARAVEVTEETLLKDLQALVEGYIEIVPFMEGVPNLYLVCNEEGKLLDNPTPNVILPFDTIYGNVVIVAEYNDGIDDDITGLPDSVVDSVIDKLNSIAVIETLED